MDKRINEKVVELRDILRETMPDDTVRVDVYFTGTEMGVSFEQRTAEDLKANMISMRNIRGEFIV